MTCADLEVFTCDYVDGTLAPGVRVEVEHHMAECPACAELARDASAAVAFMGRAAEVKTPPELLTRILFQAPWTKAPVSAGSGFRKWIQRAIHPVLQPRFVMGMAMTILSFAMLARYVAPFRQFNPADLKPTEVWASTENRMHRFWQRSVKFYENIRFVYQLQSRLREWQQVQDEQRAGGEEKQEKRDERRLPVSPQPAEKQP
jgi:anti-sigma factor RsiW